MVYECHNSCSQVDIRTWHQENQTLELCGIQSVHGVVGKRSDGSYFNSLSGDAGVSIIVAKANAIRHCRPCKAAFKNAFDMPDFWWSESCRRANGYFGYEETADTRGEPDGCRSWARFLAKQLSQSGPSYFWVKLNMFARWCKETNHTTVILFDPLTAVSPQLCASLIDDVTDGELADPFWIYPRLLGVMADVQNTSVWTARTLIRNAEKARLQHSGRERRVLRYNTLNDTARHVIHISEVLAVSASSVEKIASGHERFLGTLGSHQEDASSSKSRLASRNIANRLSFYHDLLLGNRQRSEANRERVQNEIQVDFNIISFGIAADTKQDSAAMRTIAFVTMIFLPATFISAVFSTSFFNYNPETGVWAISEKFWVYWAVSAPLTLVSFLLWFIWSKFNWFASLPIVADSEEMAMLDPEKVRVP